MTKLTDQIAARLEAWGEKFGEGIDKLLDAYDKLPEWQQFILLTIAFCVFFIAIVALCVVTLIAFALLLWLIVSIPLWVWPAALIAALPLGFAYIVVYDKKDDQ